MTKESTKRKKALETLALLGISTEILANVSVETSQESISNAEAVLAYADRRGKGFHDITCKRCGRIFSVDMNHVSYCSNSCRAAALKEIGILWDPSKRDSERWQTDRPWGRVPLVVPPDALPLIEVQVQNARVPQSNEQQNIVS